jgi:hypothetical protein
MCLALAACSKGEKQIQPSEQGKEQIGGYQLSMTPELWTPLSVENIQSLQEIQDTSNTKLPLANTIDAAFSGFSGTLMTIGQLSLPQQKIPDLTDIENYIRIVTANTVQTSKAENAAGRRGKVLYWVVNIKTADSFALKAVFYRSNTAKPLCVDFYIPLQNYSDNIGEEFSKILDSVTAK